MSQDPVESLCIGVDLGNTRVKCWALGAAADWQQGLSLADQQAIRSAAWLDRVMQWRDQLVRSLPIASAQPAVEWVIASVQATITGRFCDRITSHFPSDRFRILSSADVPLRTRLPARQKIGIDRLLTSWVAWQNNRRGEPGPTIVADAGSALTIDWTGVEGEFRGGAILPGVQLQLQSLGEHIPALSAAVESIIQQHLSPQPATAVPSFPGIDTESAIAVGVYTSAAATIDRFVQQVELESATRVQLWLTGGDAPRIAPWLESEYRLEPDLMRDAINRLIYV